MMGEVLVEGNVDMAKITHRWWFKSPASQTDLMTVLQPPMENGLTLQSFDFDI